MTPEALALEFLRDHRDWSVLLDEHGGFLGLAAPGTDEYWQRYFSDRSDGEAN